MAEPTLTEIFGPGSSQTATTITIDKTDLTSTGLTADASNTAESLLAALILKGADFLTAANFDTNADQSITVVEGFASIITANDGRSLRQKQKTINFHTVDANAVIAPNDY